MTINAAVDICNLALSHLGQNRISDIENPQTASEETMALHYDQVRRLCIEDWTWKFARKRAVVSRDAANEPEFDYADAYQMPNDCVRVISVNGDREIDYDPNIDIEGRHILMNNGGAATINLRYMADISDVKKMPARFINVFALTLALKTAYAYTLKKGLVEQLSEQLKLDLPKAVSVDGQQRPPKRVQKSKYIAARRLGHSSLYANPLYDAEIVEGT